MKFNALYTACAHIFTKEVKTMAAQVLGAVLWEDCECFEYIYYYWELSLQDRYDNSFLSKLKLLRIKQYKQCFF